MIFLNLSFTKKNRLLGFYSVHGWHQSLNLEKVKFYVFVCHILAQRPCAAKQDYRHNVATSGLTQGFYCY